MNKNGRCLYKLVFLLVFCPSLSCCFFYSLSNETVSGNFSLLHVHISINLCLLHLLWIYIGKMSLIFLILLCLIQIPDWHTWFPSLLFQKRLTIFSIPNSKGPYLHLIIEEQALRCVLKPTPWKWLEVQKSNLQRSDLVFECFSPKVCYMIWHNVHVFTKLSKLHFVNSCCFQWDLCSQIKDCEPRRM